MRLSGSRLIRRALVSVKQAGATRILSRNRRDPRSKLGTRLCIPIAVFSVSLAGFIITGCDDDSAQPEPGTSRPGTTGRAERPGRVIDVAVPCGSGWFETHGDPNVGIHLGRLAYDGDVLGYSDRRRYGDYLAKAPLAIEGTGSQPVTVRVREQDEGSIALAYGHIEPSVPRRRAAVQMTLEPCPQRPRTSFVGALLVDRPGRVVTLAVELAPGQTRHLRLPRSPGVAPG